MFPRGLIATAAIAGSLMRERGTVAVLGVRTGITHVVGSLLN